MIRQAKELFFFGLSGIVGYLVDSTLTILFAPLVGVYIARIPSFIVASAVTWRINKSLAFRSRQSRYTNPFKEYLHYVFLTLGGLLINYTVYAVAITLLPHDALSILFAVGIGALIAMVVNYLVSRKYIFNENRKDS